ncbi:MAG: hypothetical protein ACREQW_12745 [Candidatus Binatia bacterium]
MEAENDGWGKLAQKRGTLPHSCLKKGSPLSRAGMRYKESADQYYSEFLPCGKRFLDCSSRSLSRRCAPDSPDSRPFPTVGKKLATRFIIIRDQDTPAHFVT